MKIGLIITNVVLALASLSLFFYSPAQEVRVTTVPTAVDSVPSEEKPKDKPDEIVPQVFDRNVPVKNITVDAVLAATSEIQLRRGEATTILTNGNCLVKIYHNAVEKQAIIPKGTKFKVFKFLIDGTTADGLLINDENKIAVYLKLVSDGGHRIDLYIVAGEELYEGKDYRIYSKLKKFRTAKVYELDAFFTVLKLQGEPEIITTFR